jgi:uncharacterized cupredoxin-like copper-binding protein
VPLPRVRRSPCPASWRLARAAVLVVAGAAVAAATAACETGATPPTPPVSPGTASAPREVNIIAKDYLFLPQVVDLVPGETVLFHVINGGLEVHEAIIGDMGVQQAWEEAEAAHADPPPGPTPFVTVPAGAAGLRVVVRSGERIDVMWTVPAAIGSPLVVGCHIPGHWAKGMQVPVRLVGRPGGREASPVVDARPGRRSPGIAGTSRSAG